MKIPGRLNIIMRDDNLAAMLYPHAAEATRGRIYIIDALYEDRRDHPIDRLSVGTYVTQWGPLKPENTYYNSCEWDPYNHGLHLLVVLDPEPQEGKGRPRLVFACDYTGRHWAKRVIHDDLVGVGFAAGPVLKLPVPSNEDTATETENSKIRYWEATSGAQVELNKIRRRHALMRRCGPTDQMALIFKPDIEDLANATGVSSSTVRAWVQGKHVSDEAAAKISKFFGMYPEEYQPRIWSRNRS